jgi:peroxiredoxin
MKSIFLGAFALFALLIVPVAHAAPEIGKPAPEFTGTDSNGQSHRLSDFKGKIVVLEWTNPECPYVKKHYDSRNMQNLQKEFTGKDVVWLSINSGAKGKQGHQSPDEANKYIEEKGSMATARLLDETGEIGKAYGAKTTPHMYVINKEGVLVYDGAIDDNDSTASESVAKAKNYVRAALEEVMAGKPVTTAQTKPYGCSVKY